MLISEGLPRTGTRLLRGARTWWLLGAGGYAKLGPRQVDAAGELLPDARRSLDEAGLFDARTPRSYSLTVLTSSNCNLGCGYCFQNTGQDPTGGHRPPRILSTRLTSETITDVLDFTAERMAAVGLGRLSLMLFGGEPLLNPRGATELLTRAAAMSDMNAAMVSNGTLLTPLIAKELEAAGLGFVQVTFDGDRPEHDSIRTSRSGGATFDLIVDNVARAMESTSLRWQLRVNVSHRNRHTIDRLVERLAARLVPTRCSLQFELVGDVGIGYDNDLVLGDALAGDFADWHRRALELGFAVPRPKADSGCQACSTKDGKWGAVVNADGVLASCWETAGRPDWAVGTVATGYLPQEETAHLWTSCHDQYQYPGQHGSRASFQDTVDADLLDLLDSVGAI